MFLLNLTRSLHIYSKTKYVHILTVHQKIISNSKYSILINWHITVCNKNGRVLKESEILFCHKDTCPVFTNPQVINKEVETYSVLVTYHDQWISIRVSEFSSELSSKHKKRKYHAWNLNIFHIGQTIHIVQRPENNWLRNHLCWGLILFMMQTWGKWNEVIGKNKF